MDGTRLALLMVGIFFLAYGLLAYRFFFAILGGATGLVAGVLVLPTLLKVPQLAAHKVEVTLALLVLLLVLGILLIHFLRKAVLFLGGLASGIILAHFATQGLAAADILSRLPRLSEIHAVDILVGVLLGILFLIFESFFAVVLTSFAGAFLCTWALGGRWTFAIAFGLGLLLQPILARFLPLPAHSQGGGKGRGKRDRDGE